MLGLGFKSRYIRIPDSNLQFIIPWFMTDFNFQQFTYTKLNCEYFIAYDLFWVCTFNNIRPTQIFSLKPKNSSPGNVSGFTTSTGSFPSSLSSYSFYSLFLITMQTKIPIFRKFWLIRQLPDNTGLLYFLAWIIQEK